MNMNGLRSGIFLLLSAGTAGRLPAGDLEPLKDGDRACFLGDSITYSGLYHRYIGLFHSTRYPERAVEILNHGVCGDTLGGALARLDWDVLSRRPTVVFVLFGMNDVDRNLYGIEAPSPTVRKQREERLAWYGANLRRLVDRVTESGARTVLMTPSIYDDTAELPSKNLFGVNAALGRCADIVREVAVEKQCGLIDLHTPLCALTAQVQAHDRSATLIGDDRVHPEPAGHLLMAYYALQSMDVAGRVSSVEIDAAAPTLVRAERCHVGNLRSEGAALAFDLLADSLPFPLPERCESVPALVPWTEDLNREVLKVTGLPSGHHALSIDGIEVGLFPAEQLADGVNLATNTRTPQHRQAETIAALHRQRHILIVGQLRPLAPVETHLRKGGEIDVDDVAALPAAIDAWLEARRKAGQLTEDTERTYRSYAKGKLAEAETLERVRSLDVQIRAAGKPVRRTYRLTRGTSPRSSTGQP